MHDFKNFKESSLIELIGPDDAEVAAEEYSKSAVLALSGPSRGEILSVRLVASTTGSGAVLKTAGELLVFTADPNISAGDAALAEAGAEHKTILKNIPVPTTKWNGDANGAVAVVDVSIPFSGLQNIFFAFRPAAGETPINSLAADNEHLDLVVMFAANSF